MRQKLYGAALIPNSEFSKVKRCTISNTIKNQKQLFLMSAVGIILVVIFNYIPMWGIFISFKKYSLYKGFFESPWVGFKNFSDLFNDVYFWRLIKNTFVINFFNVSLGFPLPIVLALLLNELKAKRFKKLTQTITYIPHFVAVVIVVGILKQLFAANGIINQTLGTEINFSSNPAYFVPMYIGSEIWQQLGWNTIIFLAAIAGINSELYEAANIDGSTRLKNMIHITIPSIYNVIIILLILRVGRMMTLGFEKIYLMYSPAVYETADTFATYVYRVGIEGARFGYATAVGLFNNIINLALLVTSNIIARKVSDYSLW